MKSDPMKQKFEQVYQAESDAVFRYCFFRISNRETALDLTQDTFMRFWDALIKQKDIQNTKAFIFMIARNLVIDFYRKKKSISLDVILDEGGEGMFMAEEKSRIEYIEMSSEARFALDKIALLEPLYQQIIYMRFVEDLKPKEIAEVLGVSSNVISVRIVRGLQKLRELVGLGDKVEDK